MMSAAPRTRHLLLGIALLATLAAAVWVSGRGPERGAPSAAGPATASPTRPAAVPAAGRAAMAPAAAGASTAGPAPRPASGSEIPDLFPRQTWRLPPPPPTPTVPPLPFTYLGKYIDGGEVVVFVSSSERNLTVRKGDVIDGSWRVDDIAPPTLTFTYLPLDQKQTLEIGRTN